MHLCWNVEHVADWFPVRSELVFETITSLNLGFSKWREAHFVPNGPLEGSG
jgi:hypothetical protein